MSNDKMRILKLLEDKKITSGEAIELLDALGDSQTKTDGARHPRALRIRLYEGGMPDPKVNINIPLGWAKFMAPLIEGAIKSKLANKGLNIDLGKIQEAVDNQEPVRIVDIQDGTDKIEIFIE